MPISRGTLLSFHHLPHPTSTPLLPQQIESFCSPRQLPRPTHRPRTHQPSTSLLLLLLLLPLSFLIRLAARGRIVLPQLVCGPRASKSGGDRKSTVFRERCAAENWSVSRSWYRVVAGKPALRHPFLLAHFILGSLKTLDHTESAPLPSPPSSFFLRLELSGFFRSTVSRRQRSPMLLIRGFLFIADVSFPPHPLPPSFGLSARLAVASREGGLGFLLVLGGLFRADGFSIVFGEVLFW